MCPRNRLLLNHDSKTEPPRGEGMDEEISTWMRLFRLLPIMHIEVVRTSLYADLARSLALHCLIGTLAVLPWHLGRGLCRPPGGRSQWDGRAGVVPARRVGQCL
ncbi:hypothetical protein V8C26DRAFT_408650 [Trichoderma gracile]